MIKLSKILSAVFLSGLSSYALAVVPPGCNMVPSSKVCIDATPCKTTSGIQVCLANATNAPADALKVTQTCWQWNHQFACDSDRVDSTIGQYQNDPKCTLQSSTCVDKIPENGKCTETEYNYRCETAAAVTTPATVCTNGLFNTPEEPHPGSNSLSKSALAMEILHEGSTYGKNGMDLFGGVKETCSKGYFGIKNCCKSTPGAKANNQVAGLAMSAGFSVAKYAAQRAVDAISPYAFDAMFAGGPFTAGLAWKFASSSGNVVVDAFGESQVATQYAAGGPTLSAYGFTYQSSAAAAQSSGLFGANSTIATFGEGTSSTVITFNPYVFAAMVVINVIQNLASCSEAEQSLALHRGANLSIFLEEHCSKKIPLIGTCIEWTSSFCSFNTVLARIINPQAKQQLGQDVNDCKGLSVEDISKVDFSKIDMSEFAQTMNDQAVKGLPSNIKDAYTPIMQNTPKGSSQGGNILLPTYPKP